MPITSSLEFKKHGKRYKVYAGVTFGWIQDYHNSLQYTGAKSEWLFRMSPNAYLLSEDDLLFIAGFLSAINEKEPLS